MVIHDQRAPANCIQLGAEQQLEDIRKVIETAKEDLASLKNPTSRALDARNNTLSSLKSLAKIKPASQKISREELKMENESVNDNLNGYVRCTS